MRFARKAPTPVEVRSETSSDAGPRFLMAPPSHLRTLHLLNPWMRWDEQIDLVAARRQWERLVEVLISVGARVDVMAPSPRSGAMTFTRDTAVVVDAARAVVLRNHGMRGELEPRHVAAWLRRNGFEVHQLPDDDRLDGGNIVHITGGWLVGIPPGTDPEAPRRLAQRMGWQPAIGVPLRGGRFGHLDTVLADLGGRGWLVHPDGLADSMLDGPEWVRIWACRQVIEVQPEEARSLCCNVVVVGDAVIGSLSTRLCRSIEQLGLEPMPLVLDEFCKAGGGARCLTLRLR